MIGFAAPAWLLGLLLVPFIWYLHRSGPTLRRVPIASLELWRESPAFAARAGRRRRPDPAWRRRAAIAALLSLALAGPQWQRVTPQITVWLDDSLSMRANDAAGSRLQQGIALAQAAAREVSAREVVVRRLSDPARSFPTLDLALAQRLSESSSSSEPRLPPAAALAPDRVHWLVTDGADAAVNAWAAEVPIARVLQVTGAARNVGITRLTARPQPAGGSSIAIQLRVTNGGDSRESRTVELRGDATQIGSRGIELDPGASLTLDFDTALAASTITAQLTPTDALADDDVLRVDAAAIAPLRAALLGDCPESIARAVRAHPALELTREMKADLAFECSDASAEQAVPRVRLRTGLPVAIDPDELTWSTGAAALREQLADQLPVRARGSLAVSGSDDQVLLAAGKAPLLVVRGGSPRVVETVLDVTAPGFDSGPGLPLLVNGLADIALETQLLGRVAVADRGNEASRVAPQPEPIVVAGSGSDAAVRSPSVTPLLLLVLMLLAWDVLLAARRLWRERAPAPGGLA